jgi:Skp family chaperone for outer membrane proteins
MQRTNQLRTLSLFAILSLTAIQAQAEPVTARYQPAQLAENGSERIQERTNKLRAERAQKLAENGSERTLEQSKKAAAERQELAENGSERTLEQAKRNSKLRDGQVPTIAEGGSDRLLIWHQQRSA